MHESPSSEANSHLVEFPAFYGTRRFIIAFRRPRHWSLPRARWIQSTP